MFHLRVISNYTVFFLNCKRDLYCDLDLWDCKHMLVLFDHVCHVLVLVVKLYNNIIMWRHMSRGVVQSPFILAVSVITFRSCLLILTVSVIPFRCCLLILAVSVIPFDVVYSSIFWSTLWHWHADDKCVLVYSSILMFKHSNESVSKCRLII